MAEDRATELLHIAAMAAQIGKLAAETQPPAAEVSGIAGDIAVSALKLARTLLDRDGETERRVPGQQEDGSLVFAVRVTGVGVPPCSPRELAYQMCQSWTEAVRVMEANPLAKVEVDE